MWSVSRQFREYRNGGSRDNLIGAGDLRNQPVVQRCMQLSRKRTAGWNLIKSAASA